MLKKSRKNSIFEQRSESDLNKTKEKLKRINSRTIGKVNETESKYNLPNINEKFENKKGKNINLENLKNHSRRNSILSDLASNLSSKKRDAKSPKLKKKKKKKNKKASKSIISEVGRERENIYLTEVNQKDEKKIEENKSHKYLKNKLEELKVPNNFQLRLKSSFDDIHKVINNNIDIKENKNISIEKLINKNNEDKSNKFLTIGSYIEKNNIFNTKENIHRLNNITNDNNFIKKELSKIEENKKILELCPPVESDIIGNNLNNEKIKRIKIKEKDLLNKLRINKLKIKSLIEENKKINKKQLVANYISNSCKNIKTNNIKTRNIRNFFSEKNQYYCLSDEQRNFNRQLSILNKETALNQKKFQQDLELSKQKKLKQLDLEEQQEITQKEKNLKNSKKCEKDFINKIKQKNDMILAKSYKYIKFKNSKKEKDYLFSKLRDKFENSEKKLIEKINMIKKESVVTKEELTELSNKIKEQKKIQNEEFVERKEKMKEMWKERSQTLPIYKHPLVSVIEDEDSNMLENEKEIIRQREINIKEKKNYKPPKIRINETLKNIRENRNIKTTKEASLKTELNNRINILNKNFIQLKTNKNKENESLEKNKKKNLGAPHPKPDKPIDYLKNVIIKNKKSINKKDFGMGMGNIIFNKDDNINKKNEMTLSEYIELAKSKNKEIDKRVQEKKLFLKINGGYLLNTKLGDEVGNMLIGSIQSKLDILKRLNRK